MPVGGALILNGGYGCGKTHLARAIAQMYGFYAVFVEEENLFCSIKDSYDSHSESEYRILGRLERAKLLVFDDLGAYNTNNMPWVQNIYRGVFNDRVQCGLPFIITTNLSFKANGGPSEFEERVGGRNYSRIMGAVGSAEYYINLFGVPDYRLKGFRK